MNSVYKWHWIKTHDVDCGVCWYGHIVVGTDKKSQESTGGGNSDEWCVSIQNYYVNWIIHAVSKTAPSGRCGYCARLCIGRLCLIGPYGLLINFFQWVTERLKTAAGTDGWRLLPTPLTLDFSINLRRGTMVVAQKKCIHVFYLPP